MYEWKQRSVNRVFCIVSYRIVFVSSDEKKFYGDTPVNVSWRMVRGG
jgi:hypothetical protein